MHVAPSPAPYARSLVGRLGQIQQAMEAAYSHRRDIWPLASAPLLVGASKTQPPEVLAEAIGLGLRCFGENRVQEAASKWPALRAAHADIPLQLHLIGPLQSNKVEEAVALFDVIETIDRPKIADAIARALSSPYARTRAFFLQVNTGEEPQKGGVAPRDLEALWRYCHGVLGLPIVGLMCVPPASVNPAPHFAWLAARAAQLGLPQLSMGMSHDYAMAIRLGATHVRIGSALFGERASQDLSRHDV